MRGFLTSINSNTNTSPNGQNPCAAGQIWVPTAAVGNQCQAPTTPSPACSSGAVIGPAVAEGGIADGMTRAGIDATSAVLYIFTADHINVIDNIPMTGSSSFQTGHVPLMPGTAYSIEAMDTGYYPGWFTLHAGWTNCSPIYYTEAGMGSVTYNTPYGPAATAAASTPLGQTLDVQVGEIVYVPGTTAYWYIEGSANGPFLIFKQETAANTHYAIDTPSTRSANTATGGSATATTYGPFAGGSCTSQCFAFYAASSQTFNLNLNVQLIDYSVVYGYPIEFYTALPTPNLRIGYLGMWVALNNTNTAFATGIEGGSPCPTSPYQAGYFCPVPANTPGYQSFVQLVAPLESTPTVSGIGNYQISINTGSLSGQATHVGLAVWMADQQSNDVFTATNGDSAAAVYSPVTTYGLTTLIANAGGFALTSSNVPTGEVTWVTFRT